MPATPRRLVAALAFAVGLAGCAAPERYVASPSFAPDNSGLVLNLCEAGAGCKVATLAFASGRLREFEPPSGETWFAPVYSPDGSRLAFSVADEGRPYSQLAVMNADGGGYRVLTAGSALRSWPSFSPDGRRLIYARSTRFSRQRPYNPIDSHIYEIDVATGVERPLTAMGFSRPSRPFYLPDGRRFIFSAPPAFDAADDRRRYDQVYGANTIFVMDDTDNRLVPAFTQGAESARPGISRDGNRIVFLSSTNQLDGKSGYINYDVFLREAGINRRLTRLETFVSYLALSPDGSEILFIDDKGRNGIERLWLMRLDGSAPREVRIADWTRP